jgi:hypothetical protein
MAEKNQKGTVPVDGDNMLFSIQDILKKDPHEYERMHFEIMDKNYVIRPNDALLATVIENKAEEIKMYVQFKCKTFKFEDKEKVMF